MRLHRGLYVPRFLLTCFWIFLDINIIYEKLTIAMTDIVTSISYISGTKDILGTHYFSFYQARKVYKIDSFYVQLLKCPTYCKYRIHLTKIKPFDRFYICRFNLESRSKSPFALFWTYPYIISIYVQYCTGTGSIVAKHYLNDDLHMIWIIVIKWYIVHDNRRLIH